MLFRLAFASLVFEAFILQSCQIKLFINWPQAKLHHREKLVSRLPNISLTNPSVLLLLLSLASCKDPLPLSHSLFSLNFIQDGTICTTLLQAVVYQFMQFESSKEFSNHHIKTASRPNRSVVRAAAACDFRIKTQEYQTESEWAAIERRFNQAWPFGGSLWSIGSFYQLASHWPLTSSVVITSGVTYQACARPRISAIQKMWNSGPRKVGNNSLSPSWFADIISHRKLWSIYSSLCLLQWDKHFVGLGIERRGSMISPSPLNQVGISCLSLSVVYWHASRYPFYHCISQWV